MLKSAQLAGTPHWQHAAAAAYACDWSSQARLQPQQAQGQQAPWVEQRSPGGSRHNDRQQELPCGAECAGKEAERHKSWQSDGDSSLFSVEGNEATQPGADDAPGSTELDALLQALEATELELPGHMQPWQQDGGPQGQQSLQLQPLEDAPVEALAACEASSVLQAPILGGADAR